MHSLILAFLLTVFTILIIYLGVYLYINRTVIDTSKFTDEDWEVLRKYRYDTDLMKSIEKIRR